MKQDLLDTACDMNGTKQKGRYNFGGKTQMERTTWKMYI
jgi:hypothetical protein